MTTVDEFLEALGECGWRGCLRPSERLRGGRVGDLCREHKKVFLETLCSFLRNDQHDGRAAVSLKHLVEECKVTAWMLADRRAIEALASAESVHPELGEFGERVSNRLGVNVWEMFILDVKEARMAMRKAKGLEESGITGRAARGRKRRPKSDTGSQTDREPVPAQGGVTVQGKVKGAEEADEEQEAESEEVSRESGD